MLRSDFLTRLREGVLVGDGGLGTMISERGVGRETNYERLNLTNPEFILDIHRAYLTAGAQLIETNTFGANRTKLAQFNFAEDVVAINRAGVTLARQAAGDRVYVAGAVGPLASRHGVEAVAPVSDDDVRGLFREQIVALADAGADLLILETFSDLRQLLLALEVVKSQTDLPVICQMAFHERGHTYTGVHVSSALDALMQAGADVIGANCGRGVRCVASAVEFITGHCDVPVSAFPNAGLPEYVDGRYLYGAPLPYLIDRALDMVQRGCNLIGGCCGTTPAYIARLAEHLQERRPAPRIRIGGSPPLATPTPVELPACVSAPPVGSLLHARDQRPFIVVEVDPPRDLHYESVLHRSQQLRDMGVDAITMGDNTVATLRMSNLPLAQIVQEEADIPVILHLTCRDHNLLGLQSLLMGAHVMGLHHVLALTGDPARVGDQPGATSVYDLNSFGLIELIGKFNRGLNNAGLPLGKPTTFTVGVAFNANGRNLPGQVARLRKKVACGAHFAMTQPIYEAERYQQMRLLTADLGIPILVGVMPLLSGRNAEFLHNEVPGISLTDGIRRRMQGLGGKDGRAEGLRICKELIDAMVDTADGFYLIPPQIRTEMAVELVDYIHQRLPARAGPPFIEVFGGPRCARPTLQVEGLWVGWVERSEGHHLGHVFSYNNPMLPLAERLNAQARALGFDLVGIAPAVSPPGVESLRAWLEKGCAGEMDYMARHAAAREHPRAVLPEVKSVVMVALNYRTRKDEGSRRKDEADDGARGRIAAYAWGEDYHGVLWDRLNRLLAWVQQEAPGCRGRAVVDTAPLLERDFARLAGLGWFGKNTMLINTRLGSFFFLGALLLDTELPADEPFEASHCGTCTACLDACPTQAFTAPFELDARRCISYLTIELRQPIPIELRPGMDDWVFGCDICQDVCPWNRKAPVSTEPDFQQRDDLPSLIELLRLSPDQFRRRFHGTALTRPKGAGFLRNVAIGLGNHGDSRAVPALVEALHDPEPLIRGAAAWALGRIGGESAKSALTQKLVCEVDINVLTEIQQTLAMFEGERGA